MSSRVRITLRGVPKSDHIMAGSVDTAKIDGQSSRTVFEKSALLINPHSFSQATEPETEYGWIEPGELIGCIRDSPVRVVRRFWEKPLPDRARACLAQGFSFANTLCCQELGDPCHTCCQLRQKRSS
jgi:mannose-1-phosphate guanylyltransferase